LCETENNQNYNAIFINKTDVSNMYSAHKNSLIIFGLIKALSTDRCEYNICIQLKEQTDFNHT